MEDLLYTFTTTVAPVQAEGTNPWQAVLFSREARLLELCSSQETQCWSKRPRASWAWF